MGIILKHTFKNIFHKPGRTLLMTFCIFLCSLAASLCLDISNSMERIFASSMGDFAGSTDIVYNGITPVDDEFFSILPENYTLKLNSIGQNFYKRDPEMYSYAVQYCMSVYGMDIDDAKRMDVISEDLDPGLHEVIITEDMAELLEVSEGDTLTFYDVVGNEYDYVISELVPIGGFFNTKESAMVNYESQLELTCGTDNVYTLYIDIIDDSLINDTEELLKEKYPEATIMNIRNLDLLKDAIKNITRLMTTMFAMCLLVVVIINITVSERIMNERMSVVGTLRSLGVSQTGTALILLLENVLYALMGSIPGILLYSIIRDPMYSFLMSTVGMTSNIGTLSVSIKFTVILASVVIQCICTLKEVIKASRTAIRDIIFLNKDTEFRFSKLKTVSGIIMLIASVALAFIQESFAAQICCFVFSLIGVFMLFPYVTVFFARQISKLFDKLNMPVAKLAAAQIGTKRSTIASTSLIVAAAGVTILLFIYSDSSCEVYTKRTIESDIVISGIGMEDYMYDYIDDLEGVTATENSYVSTSITAKAGDLEQKNITVIGCDGNTMFKSIIGMPESVADDEFYITEQYAEKIGAKVGDTVELTLNSDQFLPTKLTLRVAGYCNTAYLQGMSSGNAVIISKKNYTNIFDDYPERIFVKTEAGMVDEVLKKIRRYSSNTASEIITTEKYYIDAERDSMEQSMATKSLSIISILLTFIGVVSNQLIGFECRKRENAVLLSVAMETGSLRKMLFIETVLSSLISLIVAVPFGMISIIPIKNIMVLLDFSFPIIMNVPNYILAAAVMLVVFSLTVLFPFNALRKMKIAAQLKYE